MFVELGGLVVIEEPELVREKYLTDFGTVHSLPFANAHRARR